MWDGQQILLKLFAMLKEVDRSDNLLRKDNEMFKSRYFTRSEKKIDNPQTIHTFFNDNPFQKFYQDISRLKRVRYDYPYSQILNRNFVVVDQKVTYGNPMTAQELEQIRMKRKSQPQVVTWGWGQPADSKIKTTEKEEQVDSKLKAIPKNNVETSKGFDCCGVCWCCGPSSTDDKVYVQNV